MIPSSLKGLAQGALTYWLPDCYRCVVRFCL